MRDRQHNDQIDIYIYIYVYALSSEVARILPNFPFFIHDETRICMCLVPANSRFASIPCENWPFYVLLREALSRNAVAAQQVFIPEVDNYLS